MARPEVMKDAPTVEDLAEQMNTLRADIAQLTQTIGQMGKATGQAAAEAARAEAAALYQKGEAQLAALRSQAGDLAHDADALVRRHPATAVGLAVGLGFLVGMMTTRR